MTKLCKFHERIARRHKDRCVCVRCLCYLAELSFDEAERLDEANAIREIFFGLLLCFGGTDARRVWHWSRKATAVARASLPRYRPHLFRRMGSGETVAVVTLDPTHLN